MVGNSAACNTTHNRLCFVLKLPFQLEGACPRDPAVEEVVHWALMPSDAVSEKSIGNRGKTWAEKREFKANSTSTRLLQYFSRISDKDASYRQAGRSFHVRNHYYEHPVMKSCSQPTMDMVMTPFSHSNRIAACTHWLLHTVHTGTRLLVFVRAKLHSPGMTARLADTTSAEPLQPGPRLLIPLYVSAKITHHSFANPVSNPHDVSPSRSQTDKTSISNNYAPTRQQLIGPATVWLCGGLSNR